MELATSLQKKFIVPKAQRQNQNGEITYSHQMLTAVLVHPDVKEVIPFVPEPNPRRMEKRKMIVSVMLPSVF